MHQPSRTGNNNLIGYEQVLHTPNVQFEIYQLALNPGGKLLAVAGAFQVAVVVLPRSGYSRLVPTAIDCKYALSDDVCLCHAYVVCMSGQYKWDNSIMHPTSLLQLPRLNGIHGEKLDQR